jgi:hypothetical protein
MKQPEWHTPENPEADWYQWAGGSQYTLFRCGFCHDRLNQEDSGRVIPCEKDDCAAIIAMRVLAK